MVTATKPRISLGGLKPLLKLDELDRDDDPAAPPREEAPRMALDLIDEDPHQPRHQYDPETLQELADSIKAEGDVLQPVSLRPHPDVPGRYIINFGHRRCRAARMAGLVDVPYFIAHKVSSFAQVIENEQREGLTAMELAMFIRDRMAEGLEQQEIARRLGKSKSYVSKAASLIEAPVVVIDAYRTGKLHSVNEAYELRNLHREHPEAVAHWARQQPEITRTGMERLRAELQALAAPADVSPASEGSTAPPSTPAPAPAAGVKSPDSPPTAKASAACAAGQTAKPAPAVLVVLGEYKGQPLELDFSAKPPAPGHFYGRRPGMQRRLMVPAADVRLQGFAGE
jgi:ParB family chromosome partitioning protein